MMDERPDIDQADLKLAREMAGSVFWQRYTAYLLERREYLHGQTPTTIEAVWRREGQLEQINRELKGEGFMVEVIRASEVRRQKEAAGETMSAPNILDWLETPSDVVS